MFHPSHGPMTGLTTSSTTSSTFREMHMLNVVTRAFHVRWIAEKTCHLHEDSYGGWTLPRFRRIQNKHRLFERCYHDCCAPQRRQADGCGNSPSRSWQLCHRTGLQGILESEAKESHQVNVTSIVLCAPKRNASGHVDTAVGRLQHKHICARHAKIG